MNPLINPDASFSHHVLHPEKFFPNNLSLPVLNYKSALKLTDNSKEEVKELLEQNQWTNAWSGGIFNYHHYHTTAHEVLVVIKGTCMLEVGGSDGNIQNLSQGDVIVLPAGVVHKCVGSSEDFMVVGAYPIGQEHDMNKCADDTGNVDAENISQVPLPGKDPILGNAGPVKEVWGNQNTQRNSITKESQF